MFGRNKFKKIKREDVVDAICAINNQQSEIERRIGENSSQIKELMDKGKKETSRDVRLFYAKKITQLQDEIKRDTRRSMYLMQNVKNLDRLKAAIDDNQFITNSTKLPLNKLLYNPKDLSAFLESSLATRNEAEENMVKADQMFENYESAQTDRQEIYGVNEADDELLAMFETEDQLDLEADASIELESQPAKKAEQEV